MIYTKPFILNDHKTNPAVKTFFSNVLNAFGDELKKLATVVYQYPSNQMGLDGLESENDVFALIERTYVGIFNNAVVRAYPNAVTLQEFGVYFETPKRGRADLFITFEDDKLGMDFLVEAKHVGEVQWKIPSQKDVIKHYSDTYNQALSYYTAEEKYYLQKPIIVTITFEWARRQDQLDAVLKETYTDDHTDFYYLFHTNSAGLLVYGTFNEFTM